MNKKFYKVIVAHPEQQHSYRLAIALKKIGILEYYMTTVYYKKNSFSYWISKFLPNMLKQKARSRHCSFLQDNEVVLYNEFLGLLKLACMHISFLKPYYQKIRRFTINCFSKRVAKYIITHKVDAVIAYDDCASELFEILKQKAPHVIRILDVSIGSPIYAKTIYQKDFIIAPTFADRLKKECNRVLSSENKYNLRECNLANYFLVPSSYVKKTLIYSGASENQFLLCPYGVDIQNFSIKKFTKKTIITPINFIYVGGVKERKGIYYLLEAFKRIPKGSAKLTIVGPINKYAKDLKDYLNHINFTGMVLHTQIPSLLQQADVFIFPSLNEGLSLSTLEAAACGLPLIVSENSGINDLITEGKEGFVIPIQSVDVIVEKIEWFIKHPNQIEIMGRSARKLAEKYSWERYYGNIENIFKKYLIG